MQRDVRWLSTAPNQFITLSADHFSLFSVDSRLQPNLVANLPVNVNARSDQDRLRCFSLSPLSDEHLALGFTSGRVMITKAAVEPDIRALKSAVELPCEPPKAVINLDFSPISLQHLTACFEGLRGTDCTVSVFDLNRPNVHIFHLNSLEHVCSTTWFFDEWSLMGMGFSRHIKLFDVRESARPTYTVPVGSSVRALIADNIAQTRFVALIDDTLHIFDRRRASSPIDKLTLNSLPKGDSAEVILRWSAHPPYFLSCLRRNSRTLIGLLTSHCTGDDSECRSSSSDEDRGVGLEETPADEVREGVSLFEMPENIDESHGMLYAEEFDLEQEDYHPFLETSHYFLSPPKLSGFSWHPKYHNRLLLTGPEEFHNASNIRIVEVNNFSPNSISPQGCLAVSSDKELRIHEIHETVPEIEESDIALIMRSRARRHYGTPGTTSLEGTGDPKVAEEKKQNDFTKETFREAFLAYVSSCKEVIDTCEYASEDTRWVWKWLRHMVSVVDWKPIVYGTWFPGVLQVMQHGLGPDRTSTTERIIVSDPLLGRLRIYKGKERERVLRLCGWPTLDDIAQLDHFLAENSLERVSQSRAVAVALFSGHSVKMKKILITMLELAKATNDKGREEIEKFYDALGHYRGVSELWKPISESLKKVIRDPYFNMVLIFLNGRCDNFTDQHQIIWQDDIPLEDRIAFAAIHFSDQSFLKSITALLNETGLYCSLRGLLIVGLGQHTDTHRLLGEYVDDTGDIQTSSILLIVGQSFPSGEARSSLFSLDDSTFVPGDMLNLFDADSDDFTKMDSFVLRSYNTVQEYLEMLNTWSLWMQRARLNCLLHWKKNLLWRNPKMDQGTSEAEVCCQFCSSPVTLMEKSGHSNISISSTVLFSSRSSLSSATSSPSSTCIGSREIACQHCMKPLPKCVLCRRHMGSLVPTECPELGSLSSWFTWCQVCRHGGHMAHLWHWFSARDECPASGCGCLCSLADLDSFRRRRNPRDLCVHCEGI